jgi:hypothetical protein
MTNPPKEPSREPVPLHDALQELAGAEPKDLLRLERLRRSRADTARQIAARNLLRGSAEHHREILEDPEAEPEAREDSRRGVLGDEADLLDADPTAHAHDEPEEDT